MNSTVTAAASLTLAASALQPMAPPTATARAGSYESVSVAVWKYIDNSTGHYFRLARDNHRPH
jgi:hypothetical protein